MSEVFGEPPARQAALAATLAQIKTDGVQERVRALEEEKGRAQGGELTRLRHKIEELEAQKRQTVEASAACRDLSKINAQEIFEWEKKAIELQFKEAVELLRDNIREEIQHEIDRLEKAQQADSAEDSKRTNTRSLRSNAKDSDTDKGNSTKKRKPNTSTSAVLERSLDDAEIDCDLQDMNEENASALLRLVQEETAFAGEVTGGPLGAAARYAIGEAEKRRNFEENGAPSAEALGGGVTRVFKGQLRYYFPTGRQTTFVKGDLVIVLPMGYRGPVNAEDAGAQAFHGRIVSINVLGLLLDHQVNEEDTMHVSVDDLRNRVYQLRRPNEDASDTD